MKRDMYVSPVWKSVGGEAAVFWRAEGCQGAGRLGNLDVKMCDNVDDCMD